VHDKRIPEEPRKRISSEWNDEKSRVMKTLNSNYLEYINNIDTHVQEWMDIMDTDHDGLISKDEFTKNFLTTTAKLGIDLDGSIRAYGLDDNVKSTLAHVDAALGRLKTPEMPETPNATALPEIQLSSGLTEDAPDARETDLSLKSNVQSSPSTNATLSTL